MDDSRTIYCGNLAKEVTEELLYELFLQAGPVDRVNIPKDKQGIKRNFGFIVFKHDSSVPYAVELMSGEKLFGQILRLQARSNNSESSPDSFRHPIIRHQKTMSCPPGFSFNHRKNYEQGSRSGNGEDYSSQQVGLQQRLNSPAGPINSYNGPVFVNNAMLPQNFALCPVDLPLALRPENNFISQAQYYQQNWPVRGNRWMRK